jgi:hypothetical protein
VSAKIQVRRDTAVNWTAANPVLLRGEIGFEYDTVKVKIGNGTSAWNALAYAIISQTMVEELIADHADRTDNPHSVTKAQVGLGSVDNVAAADLRDRSTHTGTQTVSTISDFNTAADARITLQKGDALGLATLDAGGKVPSSQLPSTIMEFKGTWDASTNTPTLADGNPPNAPEDSGHVYVCSVSGTADFGSGSVTFAAGDWVILSGSLIWQKSVNSNLVASINGYQGVVVLTKADVGLGNVSNLAPADLPVSTATQTALNLKYDASNPSAYVNAAGAASAAPVQSVAGRTGAVTLTKSDVGLGSVDNVSAASLRDRSTHTGTQLAATISDFNGAAQSAVGTILADSLSVDFTYDIAGSISADVIDGSITNVKVASGIDAAKIGSGVVSNTEFATLDGIDTAQTIQTQISARDVAVLGYQLAGVTGHIHTSPLTSIEANGLMNGTLASVVKNSSLNAGHVHATTITWDATNKLFLYSVALAAGHVHDVVAQQVSGTETTVTWTEVSEPAAPTAGLTTYAETVAGRQMFGQKPKAGKAYPFQPSIGALATQLWIANANTSTSTVWGQVAPTATGTATARTVATTNPFTWQRRIGHVSAGTAGQTSGLRSAVLQFGIGNAAGTGGFFFQTRFGISDAALVANARSAIGMTATTTAFTNADPSTFLNFLGMAHDAADTNWQIMFNDGAGAATKVDLGASFSRSPTVSTVMYDLVLWCAPNTTTVNYEVKNLANAAVATGTMTTNIPANTQLLTWQLWRSNNATAAAVALDIASIYIETEL